jgi:tetratricopeptide (TPR) repeat protein
LSQEFASAAPLSMSAEPDSSLRIYTLQSKAMTQLAHGTCVVIASLLAIPDGIALIPQSTDLVSWILKVIGVWLSAAVLWFVGFLGILHCVAFLVRGVEVNCDGVRLWRLARPIPWQKIDAVAMEPQFLFSKIFSLTPVAKKLTIFERKNSWRKGSEPHLVPHHVPSFLFAPADFERLLADITSEKFHIVPTSSDVVVADHSSFGRLKSVYGMLGWQRIALSILITFGLVSLLGRKAVVNYQYNSGNKAMRLKDYATARSRYETASIVDPTFAAAWNNLANAEFLLGDYLNAEKHWQRALFYKPDFVEAKISLANIALRKRDFDAARDYIDSALNLAPLNAAAIVTRADYAMHIGRVHDAVSDAREVLSDDPNRTGDMRFTAACILAQGRLRQKHLDEAQKILNEYAPVKDPTVRDGRNITLRLLVSSELNRALNKPEAAKVAIEAAIKRSPQSEELLIEKARVQIALSDLKGAATTLDAAQKLNAQDPWIYITRSQYLTGNDLKTRQLKTSDLKTSASKRSDLNSDQSIRDYLKSALDCPNQDAESLAQIAKLYEQSGDMDSAREAATRATKIESNTPLALTILRRFTRYAQFSQK